MTQMTLGSNNCEDLESQDQSAGNGSATPFLPNSNPAHPAPPAPVQQTTSSANVPSHNVSIPDVDELKWRGCYIVTMITVLGAFRLLLGYVPPSAASIFVHQLVDTLIQRFKPRVLTEYEEEDWSMNSMWISTGVSLVPVGVFLSGVSVGPSFDEAYASHQHAN